MERFLTIGDASVAELARVIEMAEAMRAAGRASHERVLAGRCLATVFEKPSLRTRVSFEQAVVELGGHAIVMGGGEVGIADREPPGDVGRVLQGMVDGLAARVIAHDSLERVAATGLPVINLLSDEAHPCQAIADWLTLRDAFGPELAGRRLAFVGDGNNVARSLAVLCAKLGIRFALASPAGYGFDESFLARVSESGGDPALLSRQPDPAAAVDAADAVYTDTWVSMGQETEADRREAAFRGYQVNAELLGRAPDHAIVLHCLPAKRGCEISDEVIEGPRSWVFRQAHNRLHAQKGILAAMFR